MVNLEGFNKFRSNFLERVLHRQCSVLRVASYLEPTVLAMLKLMSGPYAYF